MPEHGERVGILRVARRQDLQLRPVGERQPQILRHAVRLDEHGLLGELRPDRARRVEPARPVGQLELGRVGEDHLHRRRRIVGRRRTPEGRAWFTRPSDTPSTRRAADDSSMPLPAYTGPFGPEQAERLLWRAGFGPRPGEESSPRRQGARRCRRLAAPDRARPARRSAALDRRPPPLPARQVRPRPPLVARPDGAHESSSDRADDARLARLVRDLEPDRRLAAADDPPEQHVPPLRARLVSRSRNARDREPRDAPLPQRAREREGRAERELRARVDGALHARPRLRLHRA